MQNRRLQVVRRDFVLHGENQKGQVSIQRDLTLLFAPLTLLFAPQAGDQRIQECRRRQEYEDIGIDEQNPFTHRNAIPRLFVQQLGGPSAFAQANEHLCRSDYPSKCAGSGIDESVIVLHDPVA